MGQLAYGVVGAVVGYFIPGVGPAIGWAIGSGIGAVATAEDIVGPRLQDLKVQSSTYGLPINLVYGTARISGNVIWSTDLIEHENEDSSKGGPSIVSYSYTVSCAVALCEGEIAGVQKIWANNELIYDVTPENTGPTGQGGFIDTVTNAITTVINAPAIGYRIKVYAGSETQTADPRMQAELGAANVPAYRGLAYVVFEDLPLEKFGNRVPNFNFQVVKSGTLARIAPISINPAAGNFPLYDPITNRMVTNALSSSAMLVFTDVSSGETLTTITVPYTIYDIYPGAAGTFWVICEANNTAYIYSWESMGLLETVTLPIYGYHGAWNDLRNEMIICGTSALDERITIFETTTSTYTVTPTTGTYNVWGSILVIPNIYADKVGRYSRHGWVVLYNGDRIVVLDAGYVVALDYQIPAPNTIYGNFQKQIAYDPRRDVVYLLDYLGNTLYVLDMGGLSVTSYTYVSWVTNQEWICYHAQSDRLVVLGSGSQCWVSVIDPDNLANPDMFVITSPLNLGGWPVEVAGASDSIYTSTRNNGLYQIPFYPRLTSTTSVLGDIVEDQCLRAGLLVADVDVTALTDSVDGYVVTQQASGRSNVEPLQIGYFFDAVESDDVLKFVKRGGSSSAVTIPESDIGAYEYGTDTPPLLEQTRTQETELPRQVSVNYLNLGAEHQQGTQYDRRLTGSANIETTLSLPLALSNDSAARIAAVNLYAAWANRNRVKFKTGLEYSRYEPTDVVTVNKGNTAHTLRIVKKDEGGNGLIEWEAVSEDSSVYSQSLTGAAPLSMPTQTINTPVYTRLELLDIPLLRDADEGAGCYYAACGYRPGWDGMVLYRSADGGASWGQIASLTHESVIGSATTTLGSFSGGHVVDELNSVTVRLANTGLTLSGVSLANLLAGSNACLIGDEVMGFRDATLNADGSYTLTGLLRGLRGTGWAMATHAAGDRFVLFSVASTRRLALDSSEIGLARVYRGVSIYTTLEHTREEDFTNTAIGLKPYAPARLGGGRDASGNLTVNWVRCTRIGGEWRDYVDASQPEASLAYEVEVWDSTYTTLKRTITGIASETTSYTSAQQVTDFGSNQATVYLRVYQISATVGRGYKLEGTV